MNNCCEGQWKQWTGPAGPGLYQNLTQNEFAGLNFRLKEKKNEDYKREKHIFLCSGACILRALPVLPLPISLFVILARTCNWILKSVSALWNLHNLMALQSGCSRLLLIWPFDWKTLFWLQICVSPEIKRKVQRCEKRKTSKSHGFPIILIQIYMYSNFGNSFVFALFRSVLTLSGPQGFFPLCWQQDGDRQRDTAFREAWQAPLVIFPPPPIDSVSSGSVLAELPISEQLNNMPSSVLWGKTHT